MVCIRCKEDKNQEEFHFRYNKDIRQSVCKQCQAEDAKTMQLRNRVDDLSIRLSGIYALMKDIIYACDTRDSKQLKFCIEKARVEIKGVRFRAKAN